MGSHSTHRVSDVRIRRAEGKTVAFQKSGNGLPGSGIASDGGHGRSIAFKFVFHPFLTGKDQLQTGNRFAGNQTGQSLDIAGLQQNPESEIDAV